MHVQRVSREWSILNEVVLALMFIGFLVGGAHVKELLVTRVVVDERKEAMKGIRIVLIELLCI